MPRVDPIPIPPLRTANIRFTRSNVKEEVEMSAADAVKIVLYHEASVPSRICADATHDESNSQKTQPKIGRLTKDMLPLLLSGRCANIEVYLV